MIKSKIGVIFSKFLRELVCCCLLVFFSSFLLVHEYSFPQLEETG